jgi:hypothetical protein
MGTLADIFPEWLTSGFAVYRFTEASDAFGAPEKTWSVEPVWEGSGVLRQMSGDQQFAAFHHGYAATHRLYLDPVTTTTATPPVEVTTDIQPGDRVEYDGKTYDVKAVNDVHQQGDLLQVDLLWRQNDGSLSTPTS